MQRQRDFTEFHEIESAIARLVLAYERLRLAKALGKLVLAQAGIQAGCPQDTLQPDLRVGPN